MAKGPTVAVVGASTDPSKYGNKAIHAYLRDGWEVYPVNPKAVSIEGLTCYATVRQVPQPLDRVSLYLPPQLGLHVLADIAAVRPREFYVNPGAESDELLAKARELGLEPILACSILAVGIDPSEV